MTTREEIEGAFRRGERRAPLLFALNDRVAVTDQSGNTETGFVVSIVSVEPEIVLLVELENGTGDIHVAQASLALASGAGGDS